MSDFGFETAVSGPEGSGADAPSTNRGAIFTSSESSHLEGVQLHIDWLSLTYPGEFVMRKDNFQPWLESEDPELLNAVFVKTSVDDVQMLGTMLLGCGLDDWTDLPMGGQGYQFGKLGPGGARLWWGGKGEDGSYRGDVHLSLPGQACNSVTEERLRAFLGISKRRGVKATRIDVALDDFQRRVGVLDVAAALDGPEAVTRAREYTVMRKASIGGRQRDAEERRRMALEDGWSSEVTGLTCYVGSAASDQRLRVYDKFLESAGTEEPINAIRWELQTRREAAETFLVQLVQAGAEWPEVARQRFTSYLDFRQETNDSNSARRPRASWYASLMNDLRERLRAYRPKPIRTYPEAVGWLRKQVSRLLGVVLDVEVQRTGNLDALNEIAQEGKVHWKPKHRALVVAGLAT